MSDADEPEAFLPKGAAERDTLVLNYTMACPLKCDFCCYGCHPKRSEKMPLDLALRLVQQASEIPSITCIGLTGGEPLLHWEDIRTLTTYLSKLQLPFTIATAAHWASTATEAHRVSDVLTRNGLSRANVSSDPSHAAFVPKSSTINAARAFIDNGIETHIVGTFDNVDDANEYFADFPLSPLLRVHSRIIAKVGRARKYMPRDEPLINAESLTCYRRVYHDLVVFYDGKAYPCCSTFNRATPGIAIGDTTTEPLRDIWTRLQGSLKFRMMKREGFAHLYDIVKERSPAVFARLPPLVGNRGPCSLCNSIFSDAQITLEINEIFASYELEQISNLLSYVAQRYGPHTVEGITDQLTGGTHA